MQFNLYGISFQIWGFFQEKEFAEEKKQRKDEYETLSAKLTEKSKAGKLIHKLVSTWYGTFQFKQFEN